MQTRFIMPVQYQQHKPKHVLRLYWFYRALHSLFIHLMNLSCLTKSLWLSCHSVWKKASSTARSHLQTISGSVPTTSVASRRVEQSDLWTNRISFMPGVLHSHPSVRGIHSTAILRYSSVRHWSTHTQLSVKLALIRNTCCGFSVIHPHTHMHTHTWNTAHREKPQQSLISTLQTT